MNFDKSRLNNLKSKKVLAEILGISLERLRFLTRSNEDKYEVFIALKNGKPRKVENPNPEIKKLHHILKGILSDIPLPDYVYSGRRKVSYRDNAKVHLKNRYICSFDIEQFFPHCSRKLVEQFFHTDLKMSRDASTTLSYLVCYKDHIPTGSPISQLLAYLINYKVFDRIRKSANARGYTFSLYVDDMTFSSNDIKIQRGFHLFVNFQLRKNSLNLKKKKIHYMNGIRPKIVTGCVLDYEAQKLKAPNKLKLKTFKNSSGRNEEIDKLPLVDLRSMYGRINAIRYIEGDSLSNLKYRVENKLW